MSPSVNPYLGTAMWGRNIDRCEAFRLLDAFYRLSFRSIDCASNYPIDGDDRHWRLAERWIAEWAEARGISDLQVLMKIGSVDNSGRPTHDLRAESLRNRLMEHRSCLGPMLRSIYIHWDQRSEPSEIEETLDFLGEAQDQGYSVGLSGINRPDIYRTLLAKPRFLVLARRLGVQVKHGLLASGIGGYADLGVGRFLAYGINGGGIKPSGLSSETAFLRRKVNPEDQAKVDRWVRWVDCGRKQAGSGEPWVVDSYFGLSLLYVVWTPGVRGVILGPRTVDQLQSTLVGWTKILSASGEAIYASLDAFRASGEVNPEQWWKSR